jgi:hypothetical protein
MNAVGVSLLGLRLRRCYAGQVLDNRLARFPSVFWRFSTRLSVRLLFFALLAGVAVPLYAAGPTFLPEADRSCEATLPSGIHYTAYGRILKASYRGQTVYVDIRAYYKPGSGEFLWFGPAYSQKAYMSTEKDKARTPQELCEPKYPHILVFQDNEWVDFLVSEDKLQVLHCNLRFPTIALAWQYVARYWDEASYSFQNWSTWIPLGKELGTDFFRPASSRNSEPYTYDFLVNAQKVGESWQVEIKSADGARRALVTLTVNFRLVKATHLPAER